MEKIILGDESKSDIWRVKYDRATNKLVSFHFDDGEKIKYLKSRCERDFTPLHDAFMSSNKSAVQVLLSQGFDPNATNDRGMTPLHYADDVDIAELLISNGACIDAKDSRGETLLCLAYWKRNFELVKFLLKKQADFNYFKQQCDLQPEFTEMQLLNEMMDESDYDSEYD